MAIVAEEAGFAEVGSRRFYLLMAVAVCAVAFIGFAPSYWAPIVTGTLRVPPMFHIHGALFFTWTLFLVLQASMVANGNTARHRELGLIGISLATAMVIAGVMVSIRSMNLSASLGVAHARAFSIVPLTTILFFAVVFGYAIANVKRPHVHKRAIMLASVSLLQAAVARWFQLFLAPAGAVGPPPAVASIAPGLLADLLLVVLAVHDYRTRGRVHPVYAIGGTALLVLQLVRVPLSATPAWLAVADWFSSLAG